MPVTKGWRCTHSVTSGKLCSKPALVGAAETARYERQPEEVSKSFPGLCEEHIQELHGRNWKSFAVPVPEITPREKAFAEAAIALYTGEVEIPSVLGEYSLERHDDYYHIRGVKVTKEVLRDLLEGIADANGEEKGFYKKKGEAPGAHYKCTEKSCCTPALVGVTGLPLEARDEKDREPSNPALCLEHFNLLPERTWKCDARPVPEQTEKRMKLAEAICALYEEPEPRKKLDGYPVEYTKTTTRVGCIVVKKEILEAMLKALES